MPYNWRQHVKGRGRGRGRGSGQQGGSWRGYGGGGGGGRGRGGRGGRGGGGGGGRGGRRGGDRRSERSGPIACRSAEELDSVFRRIDGRPYPAYRDLEGSFAFEDFQLFIDKVQSDAYAPPSRVRARVPMSRAGFPRDSYTLDSKVRKLPPLKRKSRDSGDAQAPVPVPASLQRVRITALCDYLTRAFRVHQEEARQRGKTASGGGGWRGEKGGEISIDAPGQHILERNSVVLTPEYVEARFTVSLPAAGRRILGRWAGDIFTKSIPYIVSRSLLFASLDASDMWKHIYSAEDQEYLRAQLAGEGLVAFVRDGAVLPRASGVSDLPLRASFETKVVEFASPPSLRRTLPLLHADSVTGMAIKEGVTMIVGGGFHGKSTLLQALEVGVYNHVPGDGREFVVTAPDSVKIRAEDGRSVQSVDISPFINNLPHGRATDDFSTPDASGSTSQAANILEALEVGSRTLLLDEDTCATNFMIRDDKMRLLVEDAKEPITPFISKIESLKADLGVSCVLVIGGSGDYFSVADTVIMLDQYAPRDVTKKAKEIAARAQDAKSTEAGTRAPSDTRFGAVSPRMPVQSSIERLDRRTKALSLTKVSIGRSELDLVGLEQLVEKSQTRAIADIILALPRYLSRAKDLSQALDLLEQDLDDATGEQGGLDCVAPWLSGRFARPRRYEIAAALNRLRDVTIRRRR